jgi:hypothetical protein
MNLEFAVDRLYETGWTPWGGEDVEALPDGRWYPSVRQVRAEFAREGLELSLKQNLIFNCCRAAWGKRGEPREAGTVVGSCEREAAVFALAQLRATRQGAVASA